MESPRNFTTLLLVAGIVILAGCAGGLSGDSSPASPEPTNESSTVSTNGSVAVHYINVGQSVSTLITSPTGETMLVDTGHYNDNGEHVLAYLQRHDISRIDHLVTSHSDADHIGGNAAIIEYYETEADGIGTVYDPGIASSTQTYAEYLDAIETHDVTLYETREGDTINFGDVDVDVLVVYVPLLVRDGLETVRQPSRFVSRVSCVSLTDVNDDGQLVVRDAQVQQRHLAVNDLA